MAETGAGGRRNPLTSTDSTLSATVSRGGELGGMELELGLSVALHLRERRRGGGSGVALALAERARAGSKGIRRQAAGAISFAARSAQGRSPHLLTCSEVHTRREDAEQSRADFFLATTKIFGIIR